MKTKTYPNSLTRLSTELESKIEQWRAHWYIEARIFACDNRPTNAEVCGIVREMQSFFDSLSQYTWRQLDLDRAIYDNDGKLKAHLTYYAKREKILKRQYQETVETYVAINRLWRQDGANMHWQFLWYCNI